MPSNANQCLGRTPLGKGALLAISKAQYSTDCAYSDFVYLTSATQIFPQDLLTARNPRRGRKYSTYYDAPICLNSSSNLPLKIEGSPPEMHTQ